VSKQSFLANVDFWGNHEARIIEVVTLALQMLSKETSLPNNEDQLNRKLFFYIHRANRILLSRDRHLDWPLFYEARNQPDADDTARAGREDKRPDFQWGIYDHQESDPERSAKYYVLECKRLGSPSAKSPGWNLNANYVAHGATRFVNVTWAYGKSCRSGAMIGYVQSMDLPDILIEVNNAAKANSISDMTLSVEGWKTDDVSRLDNTLTRPAVLPDPFDLRHLWVDLRAGSKSSSKKARRSAKGSVNRSK
jgi:hypothetical protein